MKRYSIVIWSYAPQTVEMFSLIFANNTLTKLVFPAKMYVGNDKSKEIYLSNSKEFSTSLISVEDYSKETGRIPLYLYPENGLKFSAAALPANSISPSVITLEFTAKHLQDSVCTLEDIEMLLREIVFGFRVDQAYLYDTEPIKIPEPGGGFRMLKPNIYKRHGQEGHYRLELDWLTYFGNDYLDLIGRERFENLTTCYFKEELNNGILVILQKEPFDGTNPKHIASKKQAEIELGFDKLMKNNKGNINHD